MEEDNYKCADCGSEKGELHRYMCDIERCPKCNGQLISCDCVLDDYTFEEEMIYVSGVGYERFVVKSLEEDFG